MAGMDGLPLQCTIISAGASACFADLVTFPLDTAKVRLQIQGESKALVSVGNGVLETTAHYRGMLNTLVTITKHEGAKSLFNGLSAGLQRQLCFSSIRIGLYDSAKSIYQEKLFGNEVCQNNVTRILAGLTTGGLAVLCAQPTEVVKVRFQAQLKNGSGIRYRSTFGAYRAIALNEGTAGLWKGAIPNAWRNAIVNVAEIVCYDIIKTKIISNNYMKDGSPCHFVSAVIAGLCATTIASPVDVIKTRYMNSAQGTYKSSIHCALETLKKEGSNAFFKGFTPSFCRLVSWNVVMWLTYEKVKKFTKDYRDGKLRLVN